MEISGSDVLYHFLIFFIIKKVVDLIPGISLILRIQEGENQDEY